MATTLVTTSRACLAILFLAQCSALVLQSARQTTTLSVEGQSDCVTYLRARKKKEGQPMYTEEQIDLYCHKTEWLQVPLVWATTSREAWETNDKDDFQQLLNLVDKLSLSGIVFGRVYERSKFEHAIGTEGVAELRRDLAIKGKQEPEIYRILKDIQRVQFEREGNDETEVAEYPTEVTEYPTEYSTQLEDWDEKHITKVAPQTNYRKVGILGAIGAGIVAAIGSNFWPQTQNLMPQSDMIALQTENDLLTQHLVDMNIPPDYAASLASDPEKLDQAYRNTFDCNGPKKVCGKKTSKVVVYKWNADIERSEPKDAYFNVIAGTVGALTSSGTLGSDANTQRQQLAAFFSNMLKSDDTESDHKKHPKTRRGTPFLRDSSFENRDMPNVLLSYQMFWTLLGNQDMLDEGQTDRNYISENYDLLLTMHQLALERATSKSVFETAEDAAGKKAANMMPRPTLYCQALGGIEKKSCKERIKAWFVWHSRSIAEPTEGMNKVMEGKIHANRHERLEMINELLRVDKSHTIGDDEYSAAGWLIQKDMDATSKEKGLDFEKARAVAKDLSEKSGLPDGWACLGVSSTSSCNVQQFGAADLE